MNRRQETLSFPYTSRPIFIGAGVAQLVEQRIRNAWVGGSSPSAGTRQNKSLKTFVQCVAIGTAITLALFGLGYMAAEHGAEDLSYALYWQAYVLYMMLPCSVSISPGEFLCESMMAARVTFYAGIPVGIALYSAAAWLTLRLLRRRGAAQPQA